MEIIQSSVAFESSRQYQESAVRLETLQYRSGGSGNSPGQSSEPPQPELSPGFHVKLSPAAKANARALSPGVTPDSQAETLEPDGTAAATDSQLSILIKVIEMMTGRKVYLVRPEQFVAEGAPADFSIPEKPTPDVQAAPPPEAPAETGPGLLYTHETAYQETEKTTVHASGFFQTADGKKVSFEVDLRMASFYAHSERFELRAGSFLDPLVINYDGTAASLTQQKFSFDLDVDGNPEKIAFPAGKNGFLALDKNGDEKINDGRELFGPATGHGFSELAAYDRDHNNWIDENDSVFADLKVWHKTPDGQDKLLSLGKIGVGAIYLGRVDSAFHLHDANHQPLGRVRSTGLYARNDGGVGLVQELDLSL